MTTYSTGKAAKLLGVSVITLQQWDRDGKLKASRSPSGRRFYTDAQIRAYRAELPPRIERLCIAYVRVSSQAQRPDLKTLTVVMVCRNSGEACNDKTVGTMVLSMRPLILKDMLSSLSVPRN